MTKTEIWKPISSNMYYIVSFLNFDYEVSNFGRIRNKKTGKIINGFPTKSGNKKLKWTMHFHYSNGVPGTLQFLVDHTVYEAFVGPCYNVEVKHRDGNNFNNTLDNLYI